MKALRTGFRRYKARVLIVSVALALVGGIFIASVRLAKLKRATRTEWHSRLTANLGPTQGFLASWVDDRFADAREAASTIDEARRGARTSHAADRIADDSLVKEVAARLRRPGFLGAWVVDTMGTVVASVDDAPPRDDEVQSARDVARRFTEIVTGPTADRTGRARVAVVTPIPVRRFALLLVYDAGQTLFPLIGREGGAEHTIRTKLLAADSAGIHVLSPSAYPIAEALGRVVDRTKAPLPWRLAVAGVDSVGTFVDLDGRNMIAATTFLAIPKWGLVREIDEEEALAPAYARFRAECIVAFSLIALCTTLYAAMYRDARKRERVDSLNRRVRENRAEARRMQELNDAMERTVQERTVDLRAALHAAETANRTKSEFLARMSHELRTPLNSIIGFTNALLKNKAGNLRTQDLNYLERVADNGKNLLAHINSILDLAKIESGHMEIEMAEVDVGNLVTSVTSQLDGVLRDRAVTLHTEVPPAPALQWSDETKLRQVLVNLIGNATKFTEEGQITVRVVADPFTAQAERIEVEDTGIGIPADRLETIFKPFEQGDNTMTRRYGGTGLGLAITSSLCELLGARLTVKSTVGRGSTFVVQFNGNGNGHPERGATHL